MWISLVASVSLNFKGTDYIISENFLFNWLHAQSPRDCLLYSEGINNDYSRAITFINMAKERDTRHTGGSCKLCFLKH
jgi:hypothetical protein